MHTRRIFSPDLVDARALVIDANRVAGKRGKSCGASAAPPRAGR
jgi:hypothetical protein